MTSKLMLDAAQEGYTAQAGKEVVVNQLDGGAGRYRRDQLGATSLVSVQWFLSPTQYSYLMAFYRLKTAHGSVPFTLDILWDSGTLGTYTAYFVPNTLALYSVEGSTSTVQAQLEVIPAAENAVTDQATITAYEASL